jgi:4-aminobutyrate aminotransferase-like enzyme
MNTATERLLERRAKLLGPNVPTFYDDPVHLVRGEGVWVFDAEGRRYLDCYNNVPHVGHCHPRVVEAIARQAAMLNTHTRYLHDTMLDYLERLLATFDASLDMALMTCTGSEANDVALQIARAVTGKTGVIGTDYTYHGNTIAVSRLSSNRGKAAAADMRFVPAPDSYRPLGGSGGQAHAARFAQAVVEQIEDLEKSPYGFSAMLACPYFANEGFPDLDEGWLKPVAAAVKRAGGLLIADEIQPGFGRLGSHFWGYQRSGIVPDIVTLGKPMGNGHPVGAVVTSGDHMHRFRNAERYFNTFGGNPVSSAAALATLQVLQDEGLQANAEATGHFAKQGLRALAEKHEAIGDVRGCGLFFGAELVSDRVSKAPDAALAERIVNAMRNKGVLINRIGIHRNVLKMRPPMPFTRDNAALALDVLDECLADATAH